MPAPRNDNGDAFIVSGSMEARLNLLTQQLKRAQHSLVRDEASAIHFREDTGETEFLSQALESIGDHLWRADNGFAAQCIVIGDGLQPLATLDPPCGVGDAGTICRFFEPSAQIAVEMHQALFGV